MQRAKRNVPVYLREQQVAEEKAQEKLLLFKEQQRDKQYMEEEQVCTTPGLQPVWAKWQQQQHTDSYQS